MSCPICGANCQCKRRGPNGLCCSCHRHKVRRILVSEINALSRAERASLKQHLDWLGKQEEQQAQLLEFTRETTT